MTPEQINTIVSTMHLIQGFIGLCMVLIAIYILYKIVSFFF